MVLSKRPKYLTKQNQNYILNSYIPLEAKCKHSGDADSIVAGVDLAILSECDALIIATATLDSEQPGSLTKRR